ncbi:YvcK family protein [Candidatus Saccharibacteria bacterium]|nr:YvcK family protein [Candidatus Saccharibacteria bacterium]
MAKKITVIGGGHGSSVVLSALKDYDFDLSGIISMADNGGSTGRLRDELGVSAVGDIRQSLARLTDSEELRELFSYRFSGGELDGHSLGNLFLAAGQLMSGSIEESINIAKEALGVKVNIVPVTDSNPNLVLEQDSGTIFGVHDIATAEINKKSVLKLAPNSTLSSQASKALNEADLIVIAPGHFYCSILPALLVEGVGQALNDSNAKVVFMSNLTNINIQNEGFTPLDYLSEIGRLVGADLVDIAIYNTALISEDRLKPGESQVEFTELPQTSNYELIGIDILDDEEAKPNPNDKIAALRSKFRHDKDKVAKILTSLAGEENE